MFYRSLVLAKHTRRPQALGFSMVELLVSIGIVVLVLSIVVTRQQAFNSAVLLRSQVYDIALAMREVQLGAISAVSDGGGEFRAVQGIQFDISADSQSYRLFRDTVVNNRYYDVGEDIGFAGSLDPRFEVRSIEPSSVGNALAIVFERPNFDALFITNSSGNASAISNEPVVTITVGLRDSTGVVCGQDVRQIQVRATGQIAVLEC